MLAKFKNFKLTQLLLVIIFVSCTVPDESSVQDTTTESQDTTTTTESQDTTTESQDTTTESQDTKEIKLEIPKTIKIESEHVNCTIPGVVPEGYSGATALGYAAENGIQGLTDNFSWLDAFIGNIPGSVGETSVIAIAIAAVILLGTGVASYRIILGTILGK